MVNTKTRKALVMGGRRQFGSNKILRDILRKADGAVNKVAVLEFHTGLGPWGYGALISMHRGDALARSREWYGPWVVAPNDGEGIGDDDAHQG